MKVESPVRAVQTIGAIVITKDEEQNIGACLESLQWADQIIVVDACSTDRTVQLARSHTPHVFINPWPGYGPQKNYGIDRATTEWILIVDADERVLDALRDEIRSMLDRVPPEIVGFQVPRRNFFYGRWIQGSGYYPDYQLRLFRREAGRYDDTLLHERLVLKGRTETLRSPLEHHSMPTIRHHVRKMMRYTTLGAEEKLKTCRHVGWTDLAGRHVMTVVRTYLLRRGYRDGVHGLIVALFAGLHTFVKYAKAWEALRNGGKGVSCKGIEGERGWGKGVR
ncbi:glycosyltransferase family 2 protein [Candidatus Nitrospira bockiana]